MIGWLRRFFRACTGSWFEPRPRLTLGLPMRLGGGQMSPERRVEVAVELAHATSELVESEHASREALVELNRELLRSPGRAHRADSITVHAPPPDWAKAVGDIQEMALADVAAAELKLNDALATLRDFEKRLFESAQRADAWRVMADTLEKEIDDAQKVLTDAKISREHLTLAERIEMLVASRQRARDARDTRPKRKK